MADDSVAPEPVLAEEGEDPREATHLGERYGTKPATPHRIGHPDRRECKRNHRTPRRRNDRAEDFARVPFVWPLRITSFGGRGRASEMEAGRRGELRRIMRFLYVFSKDEPEEEQRAAEGDGHVEDELSDDEPAREE